MRCKPKGDFQNFNRGRSQPKPTDDADFFSRSGDSILKNARTARTRSIVMKKRSPDWVLMDWEMRRMNGLAATKQIIANIRRRKF